MTVKSFFYRVSHWETWHYLAKYIPIMPVWLFYCVRARSFWFFTPSNPTLTFGGFEGESKKEMFDQLPPGSYPRSLYISHASPASLLPQLVTNRGFSYPLAVKPDVGMMGFMFRKIDTPEQLLQYHHTMPVDYIIQDLITYPLEISVFYYRLPDQQKGTITGFLKKEFLELTGNGTDTVEQLMEQYDRVRFRLDEMKAKHESRLPTVLATGERYCLSNALNLSRGGKLVSLADDKDEKLHQIFDQLSHYTGNFYYGRYDIKCASIEDLKEGKNFSILEYNGCGAEPHHIYGNGNTLLEAYQILLHHWKMLYRISAYNNARGITYWRFKEGWQFLKKAKKHFRILKTLDATTEL
ncbi:MAG: hypothetical protein ABIU63_03655 [Chitinophagaceae bacterium]